MKKPLSDILFGTGPNDLPSALALAQEIETNHKRFQFANKKKELIGLNNDNKIV